VHVIKFDDFFVCHIQAPIGIFIPLCQYGISLCQNEPVLSSGNLTGFEREDPLKINLTIDHSTPDPKNEFWISVFHSGLSAFLPCQILVFVLNLGQMTRIFVNCNKYQNILYNISRCGTPVNKNLSGIWNLVCQTKGHQKKALSFSGQGL